MPSPYKARFENQQNTVIEGNLWFEDPDNRPADVNQPFKPAVDGDVVVVEDSGGDPAYDYDDDGGQHNFTGRLHVTGDTQLDGDVGIDGALTAATTLLVGTDATVQDDLAVGGDVTVDGALDAGSLGATPAYVTDGTTNPTTYVTPLVLNHTALTGGLFAWDGDSYVKVSGPLP